MKVLIFAEIALSKNTDQEASESQQIFKSSSLELFAITQQMGISPTVAVMTSHNKNHEEIIKVLSSYGAKSVVFYNDVEHYNPEIFSAVLQKVIKENEPQLVLASGTSTGRDLFPRVSAILDASFASDCTEISIEDQEVHVRKPLYAGKCSAKVILKGEQVKIVVMRSNQFPIPQPDSQLDPATATQIAPLDIPSRYIVKDVIKSSLERPDLTEAQIIVSGGRGLQKPDNFQLLEDLADAIGTAAVGASRAVVDDGWVDHSMQVGQTGKTVAPHLYIAVGISGAIQHLAGMSSSRVIVAINKNPEAPIFKKATYGIVGDALEIVPQLTEAFKKA